jgi:D-beta-D-heptose 7-phosphate kinase/D-beta-D-heptose 1-phosphate adenosyltransferase
MSPKSVVIVTGGFDPVHRGHLAYLEAAYRMGDYVIVGLNSDAWLQRKKGKQFLDFEDREAVLNALWMVDEVLEFDDSDGSAVKLIESMLETFDEAKILFCNGGDRTKENIPEMRIHDDRLEFVFGVGGVDKLNSSSDILARWEK